MSDPVFVYVDDDPSSRKIVELMLTRLLNFQFVTVYEDSADLPTRLATLSPAPNVFFLDIQMQPLDGFQVLAQLRADPRYAHTTIIAMTANVMAHDVEKLRQVGFDGLIGKPLVKDSFPDLVARILQGQSVWYIP